MASLGFGPYQKPKRMPKGRGVGKMGSLNISGEGGQVADPTLARGPKTIRISTQHLKMRRKMP